MNFRFYITEIYACFNTSNTFLNIHYTVFQISMSFEQFLDQWLHFPWQISIWYKMGSFSTNQIWPFFLRWPSIIDPATLCGIWKSNLSRIVMDGMNRVRVACLYYQMMVHVYTVSLVVSRLYSWNSSAMFSVMNLIHLTVVSSVMDIFLWKQIYHY